jgi:heme o synthase
MASLGTAVQSTIRQKVADYVLLTKVRLSMLVVSSAAVAYWVGAAIPTLENLFWLSMGGFLVTGAANAFNQILERDYDALMTRTQNRPLAAKRMEVSEALLAAGLMSLVGILIFFWRFNELAALTSALSLISYAFIYTPLKRVSPIAVWVGAIPGALPMMIGWIAATNELGFEAFLLFTIQFFWQFPHFWAIAWVSDEDYKKGGFNLLPSQGGKDKTTAVQCIVYAMMLLPLTFAALKVGLIGVWGTSAMILAAAHYIYKSVRLYQTTDNKDARALMFSSFIYLPVVLAALLIGK